MCMFAQDDRTEKSRELIDRENRAMAYIETGDNEKAAAEYEALLQEFPEWHNGRGWYNLAGCYEDLGRLKEAESAYRRGIPYDPNNPLLVGGLASFLCVHGNARESYEQHLKLLSINSQNGDEGAAADNRLVLRELGKRLGLSDGSIEQAIVSVTQT